MFVDWPSLLTLPEGPTRTAAVVEWVQHLFAPGARPPLVGGAAVELLTGGAYTTGDIDLVGEADDAVAKRLLEAEPAVERLRTVVSASSRPLDDARLEAWAREAPKP